MYIETNHYRNSLARNNCGFARTIFARSITLIGAMPRFLALELAAQYPWLPLCLSHHPGVLIFSCRHGSTWLLHDNLSALGNVPCHRCMLVFSATILGLSAVRDGLAKLSSGGITARAVA
jgi:hypothetical protein